jgi:hypothetical protein
MARLCIETRDLIYNNLCKLRRRSVRRLSHRTGGMKKLSSQPIIDSLMCGGASYELILIIFCTSGDLVDGTANANLLFPCSDKFLLQLILRIYTRSQPTFCAYVNRNTCSFAKRQNILLCLPDISNIACRVRLRKRHDILYVHICIKTCGCFMFISDRPKSP